MYSQRSSNFNDNASLLIKAAGEGDIRMAAEIISAGGLTEDEYRAALMKAAGHGHADLTKALAALPINNSYANVGAARMAAQFGHVDIFCFFINEKSVDICLKDGLFVSVAAQFGKTSILQAIKHLGFNFKECNNVAFFNACHYAHDEAAAFLVLEGMPYVKNEKTQFFERRGAHHERRDSPYDHILHMAAKGNSMLKTFNALIEMDLPYEAMCQSMIKAASYGQVELLKLLTSKGADINYNKVEALSEAARFNQRGSIEFILSMNECNKRIGLQRALKKANDYTNHNPEAGKALVFSIIYGAILNENSGVSAQNMVVRCLNGKQWDAALAMMELCPWVVNEDVVARIVKFSTEKKLLDYMLNEPFDFSQHPWVDIAIAHGNFDNAATLLEQGLVIEDINEAMLNCAKFGNRQLVQLMIKNGANEELYENFMKEESSKGMASYEQNATDNPVYMDDNIIHIETAKKDKVS